MSPDAAELFAQVDAALLIAIVVEAKFSTAVEDARREDFAWATLYALGMFSVVLSLVVTLTSVMYDKPLPSGASQVVSYATTMGIVTLFYRTMSHLLPRAAFHGFRFWILATIIAGGLVWYMLWSARFAPESLWWRWL